MSTSCVVRMRVVAAEQVPVSAYVLRERDTASRRTSRRATALQSASDSADRHAQGRLRRLRVVPRRTRSWGRPAAISEPGGRGRPPQRLHRWRGRAADCWRTASASSVPRRPASPRWRSGRLTAMTSAVSFSSHRRLSLCLSLSISLSVCLWAVVIRRVWWLY